MIDADALRGHLERALRAPVEAVRIARLGDGEPGRSDLKGFGYGTPLCVDARVRGVPRRFVLSRMRPSPGYGHDTLPDRAQSLLASHPAFNELPRHVPSLDVGFVDGSGGLVSAADARDWFLLYEFAEGQEYRVDLERIAREGRAEALDLARVDALADYLVGIHRTRKDAPHLYHRRIRELIGHGECIMGILDGYPHPYPPLPPDACERLERAAVGWRWRLRGEAHRLAMVHGDFHPWNILFREATDFVLLDRSRGEWGEPADDVAALTINYLFFALVSRGRFAGPLRQLFDRFFARYAAGSGDGAILALLPPFYLFRALVLASPRWYPTLDDGVRRAILRFTDHMGRPEPFDPAGVDTYLEA